MFKFLSCEERDRNVVQTNGTTLRNIKTGKNSNSKQCYGPTFFNGELCRFERMYSKYNVFKYLTETNEW